MSTMSTTPIVPDRGKMEEYLAEGLTQQQIAQRWEQDSGVKVSRTAVAMAISRYGLKSAHPRPRYEDTLPWKVRTEHNSLNEARMLRLEHKRRAGEQLNDWERKLLGNWRRRLSEADAVIVYAPNTKEGFFWTPRRPDDDDIIRRQAIV